MQFLDLAKKRYSVREYLDTPVEEDVLMRVLEASRQAPSACNKQPWIFIAIPKNVAQQTMGAVYTRPWFLTAPLIIAVCCDHSETWKRGDGKDHGDIDCAIALDHLTLAAAEEGLGTCWICNFSVPEAKKALRLPDHIDPVAFTTLGYHGGAAQMVKTRKNMDEILHWGHYNGKNPK